MFGTVWLRLCFKEDYNVLKNSFTCKKKHILSTKKEFINTNTQQLHLPLHCFMPHYRTQELGKINRIVHAISCPLRTFLQPQCLSFSRYEEQCVGMTLVPPTLLNYNPTSQMNSFKSRSNLTTRKIMTTSKKSVIWKTSGHAQYHNTVHILCQWRAQCPFNPFNGFLIIWGWQINNKTPPSKTTVLQKDLIL